MARPCSHARAAAARGAEGDAWRVTLLDQASGRESEVRARILVNAAGPWVKSLLERELNLESPGRVRLVKGSHIVVPRIHDKRYAYILQNPDRRVVFMIPYEREFTLIGTTDVQVSEQDLPAAISPDEVAYLCAAASRYSAREVTADQVAWSYSGVRPLYDDGKEDPSAITRDYVLLLDEQGRRCCRYSAQDHHLPQAGRAGDGQARALDPGASALDPSRGAAGRRLRRARFPDGAGRVPHALPRARPALAGAPAAPPRHAGGKILGDAKLRPTWARTSAAGCTSANLPI